MKASKHNAEHYVWGNNCDGWHLVKQDSLSVIQEQMPPGTSEVRHYHHQARQFFFVLKGKITICLTDEQIVLNPQEGLEIPPHTIHQVMNHFEEAAEFLVISQPNSKGDRELV